MMVAEKPDAENWRSSTIIISLIGDNGGTKIAKGLWTLNEVRGTSKQMPQPRGEHRSEDDLQITCLSKL